MGKHEMLPFKMLVERGRLVPATAYDAERLDTWRNGTAVNVTFVRDGGRVMERKWWAVLNRAVKECSTPWKSAAEASEAIKLAIGVVNLTKTVGGDFLQYPKSLTELDDAELDDAVRLMIDVVHHVTGVDPEEWRRQIAHIKEEPATVTEPTTRDDTGTDDRDVAVEQSTERETVDPNTLTAMKECASKFLALAADKSINDDDRRQNAKVALTAWRSELPRHLTFVESCLEGMGRIVKGTSDREREEAYLTGLIPGGTS